MAAPCLSFHKHPAQACLCAVAAAAGQCQDPVLTGSQHHPSGCAGPCGLHVPHSGAVIPGVFPGGAPLYKPRQRQLPRSRRPRTVIAAQGMMSGLAAARRDEREAAGPPPTGERLGHGEDTGGAGGMWGTSPTPWPHGSPGLLEPRAALWLRPWCRRLPEPLRVPGERCSHGCGGGHATLPTINGSLCHKQEESCFANAAELSLPTTEHPSAGLSREGSALGHTELDKERPLCAAPCSPSHRTGGSGGDVAIESKQQQGTCVGFVQCCPGRAEAAQKGKNGGSCPCAPQHLLSSHCRPQPHSLGVQHPR